MKLKQPPKIFDLFHEGLEFENSTREVEVIIRGKIQKFTIRPVGYVQSSIANAKRTKFFAMIDDVRLNDAENMGMVQLEIVSNHTMEFDELTDAIAAEHGAKNKLDFVAKCLGVDGVILLYGEIDKFSSDENETAEDKVAELAEEIKN